MTGADVVVVGGGTAGCLIARRFIDEGARVVLLEAGSSFGPDAVPDDIRDIYPRSYYNPDYAWRGLVAHQSAVGHAEATPFVQARVLGGGSSVMGMVALRGLAADYDTWGQHAAGWSSEVASEVFSRLEDDPAHGAAGQRSGGPIAIRRLERELWPPFIAAVGDAAERAGFRHLPDLNGSDEDGFGPLPLSRTDAGRVSSATAFLTADALRPGRLEIHPDTEAQRLIFDGTRCIGVVAEHDGEVVAHLADRVIVCAGAISTPLLLQRSGIGDADRLRGLGIRIVAARPGVGENLQNHPAVSLATHLPRRARQRDAIRQGYIAGLRVSSGIDGGVGDLMVTPLNKTSWHGLGTAIGGVGVSLMDPRSRGSVRLASSGPTARAVVDFDFLADAGDRLRMQHGFDLVAELLGDTGVRSIRHEVFPAGYTKTVRNLNAPGRRSVMLAAAIGALLDGPSLVRRTALSIGMSAGSLSERRLDAPGWRADAMIRNTFGTYHVAGTCAMGDPGADASVVDHRGDVIGVSGLTIADASVMPTIPRANTNLPVQMLAWRIADLQLGTPPARVAGSDTKGESA